MVGGGAEQAYITHADAGPRCVWRKTLNAQPGSAVADKTALKIVGGNDDADNGSDEISPDPDSMLAGLSPEERARAILDLILQELDDDKAEDVVTIDLAGKSEIADAMVIASGRSQRHVGAMADKVMRKLKEAGFGRARVEGQPACDWVLIDAGDVIVHLFRPEVRGFYNLERVWSEAARAPVKADA